MIKRVLFAGVLAVSALTGCMTSTKVQEMINLSTEGYDAKLKVQGDSIETLKETSQVGLDQSSQNLQRLREQGEQLQTLIRKMDEIYRIANAAKVMSAENTVKMADLEESMILYKSDTDLKIEKMANIDKLYEEVLIRQYQAIADSANAAVESLRKNGFSATTNAPVDLGKPIEIVPPDTTTP